MLTGCFMIKNRFLHSSILVASLTAFTHHAHAQLAQCAQINADPTVAINGCITKTLSEQVGAGQGDDTTADSSIFLINRDPARSIRRGRQLFQRKFSLSEGLGPRVNESSTGDIHSNKAFGAGLSDSCAACHGRPKGSAGFGGDVATRPDSRDAPHLFGLGLVEQLADEMTTELRLIQSNAISDAENNNQNIRVRLIAKGVKFGEITAFPDGTVDHSKIDGVDEDLRVKPFFHQGATSSIREFIIGAMNAEMGLQAWDPILCNATDPTNAITTVSPSGFIYDPSVDTFERPPVCSELEDSDFDGVSAELDPALIDHLEFYLLNYFKPGQYRVDKTVKRGKRIMQFIGCNDCHIPSLRIDSDRRIADVETKYDPKRGIFNQLFATASTRFDVVDDGEEYPKLLPQGESFLIDNFYSDLKRHDLGPAFYEREYDGTLVTEFVTEPLWGVGSTSPYGHDGRSINLDSVIRRHGGEAKQSAKKYSRLKSADRNAMLAFLRSLVLFPPDDTASNLKTGDKQNINDIQNPDTHGTINLGALFQINADTGE